MANKSWAGLVAGGWKDLAFEHFRDGVEVFWLEKGATDDDPSVALLKYAPGARVPRHLHRGLETIVVLDGVQSDEAGDYAAGAVVLNSAGSAHSVWSKPGCVVLINWTRAVLILDET